MNDTVSKVFSVTFGMLILFILPIMVIMINFDNEMEKYANDAMVEFVDKSRSTGYISPDNWEQFVHKIMATGKDYEIYICHESVYTYPEAGGGYSTHYYSYYRDEIVGGMYSTTYPYNTYNWNMKAGDYIRVSITQDDAGYGMRLFSALFGTEEAKHVNTYGGYVGNSNY